MSISTRPSGCVESTARIDRAILARHAGGHEAPRSVPSRLQGSPAGFPHDPGLPAVDRGIPAVSPRSHRPVDSPHRHERTGGRGVPDATGRQPPRRPEHAKSDDTPNAQREDGIQTGDSVPIKAVASTRKEKRSSREERPTLPPGRKSRFINEKALRRTRRRAVSTNKRRGRDSNPWRS